MYLVPPPNSRRHIFPCFEFFLAGNGRCGDKKALPHFGSAVRYKHTANLVFSLMLWFLPAEGTELCLIDTLNPSQCVSAQAISTGLLAQDSSVLAPFPVGVDIDLHFVLFLLKTSAKLTIEVGKHFSILKPSFSFIYNEKACFSLMARF